ncbi:hypothetical protein DBR42_21350 [Pelomonas sp. HMWF004]|nr:hypothetical protein DBR42_21350 [Pelomonas sp. HMWF004]
MRRAAPAPSMTNLLRSTGDFFKLIASALLFSNLLIFDADVRAALALLGGPGLLLSDALLKRMQRRPGLALSVMIAGSGSLVLTLVFTPASQAWLRLFWLEGAGRLAVNDFYAIALCLLLLPVLVLLNVARKSGT